MSQSALPPEVTANLSQIDVIAPMWYDIRSDGAITPIHDEMETREYVAFFRKEEIAVMPIFRNFKPLEFLLNPKAIDRAIGEMVALLEREGFDGITIDIEEEGLDSRTREPMLELTRRLHRELQQRGLLLCVTFNPVCWGRSWQTEAILSRCDWAFAMFYDYSGPWNRKAVNATAPYDWPERSRDLRRDVERIMLPAASSRIIFGIPAYGNRVTLDADGECVDFTVAYINELLREKEKAGALRQWDALARTPKFEIKEEGLRHIIWYEDQESYQWRMALAEERGAAGIGIWAAGARGGLDEALWKVTQEYREGRLSRQRE